MTFAEAFNKLEPSDKIRLARLLDRWHKLYPIDVINLWYERAMEEAKLKYLIIRLLEFTDEDSIIYIKKKLRTQFYAWLQLSGNEYIPPRNIRHFGIVIPFDRLKNQLLKNYNQTYFRRSQQVDNFLSDIIEKDRSREANTYIQEKGLGQLRIKEDNFLHWFYWDPKVQYEDPITLFSNSAEAMNGLNLPDYIARYGKLIALSFNYDRAYNNITGWKLHRPSWADADFIPEFRFAPLGIIDHGVTNADYEMKNGAKIMIAEGVSRSGTVRLDYLERCKILL